MTHPGGRPRLPLDHTAIVDAYLSGETQVSIARRLDVDRSRVTRTLIEAGVERRDDRGAHWAQKRQYAWPCDLRIAHGRHDDCPGVPAHPDTMIGHGSLPTVDEDDS